ncbi:uncharacterized protein LOC105700220 [Orussus abietinus]|uniref:uncharacterized protein LOC105700220 n=1 Tax=Orussus abietinus TaxID=222816 RepID=UPI00062529B6|nr:uncharacterized protein LOC105700220 [Orussus abietinus]
MALSTANEIGVRIVLMSEPNRHAVRNRIDWICDKDIDTAIKVMDRSIIVKRQGRGYSFTYITTTACTIYNCHSTGNKEIEDLEQILPEIEAHIRSNKEKAVIEVLEYESLSNHDYISFEVVEENRMPDRERAKNEGWQVRKLDKTKLVQVLTEMEMSHEEVEAKDFLHALSRIYIAELRRECIRKRKAYTRNARGSAPEETRHLWEESKEIKRRLRKKIKADKRASWKRLCDEVDCDIWGVGYNIVTKKMIGSLPRLQMDIQTVEEVVDHLFPVHEEVIFECNINVVFTDFSLEELSVTCSKIKENKAPEPGNIPPKIIKEFAKNKPEYVLAVYNNLADRAIYPSEWKCARLLLLRKGNKPIDNPASYRPICLLDVEGKLYDVTGGLSEQQYGFKEGRQAVNAIREYILAEDIKGAKKKGSQRKPHKPNSIIPIKERDHSRGRRKPLDKANKQRRTTRLSIGLHVMEHNVLFRIEQPEGVTLIGFADDVAMMVVAKGEELLRSTANIALQRVSNWLQDRGLQLATEKTFMDISTFEPGILKKALISRRR